MITYGLTVICDGPSASADCPDEESITIVSLPNPSDFYAAMSINSLGWRSWIPKGGSSLLHSCCPACVKFREIEK